MLNSRNGPKSVLRNINTREIKLYYSIILLCLLMGQAARSFAKSDLKFWKKVVL